MRSRWVPSLVALGMLVAGCGDGGDTTTAGLPTAPSGSRWVGWGDVVVAVPDWWTTGETRCFAPVEDTVYFDSGAVADCADGPTPAEVREVSALAVLDGTGGYGELKVRDMEPVGAVGGHPVLESQECDTWFRGVCRRLFAVPSRGVVFAVTIAEEGDGDYQQIRDSLRILPEGMTTVPLASAHGWTPTWGAEPSAVRSLREAIEAAGLQVEVVTVVHADGAAASVVTDLPRGSLLGVEPELGSVVEVGGTVTLTVSG